LRRLYDQGARRPLAWAPQLGVAHRGRHGVRDPGAHLDDERRLVLARVRLPELLRREAVSFKRIVNVIEIVTLVVVVVFVGELFANEAGGGSAAKSGPGYDLYVSNCARCHGQEGEGGIGVKLAGGAVVDAFPDPADEIRVVENGRGSMPSFKGKLS